MPLPTSSDVHVDSALTNISIAFAQNASNFISRQVFPNVPVEKQSDRYFVYDRADFQRDEAQKRAPGAESAGGGFRLDNTPTYYADVWSWHVDVPFQVEQNADASINPLDDAAEFTMQKLMIRQEAEFANTYMTTGVWDADVTGNGSGSVASGETVFWSDDTNGDPIGDVEDGKATVLQDTGFEPNTLVLGYNVFRDLKNHPDLIDRVKYAGGIGNTNPALITPQALAQVFGVDRVLISRAVQNTAAEGATASNSFIVGNNALLCYSAPSPSLMTPTAGYTFSWRNYLQTGNDMGIATSRIPMPHLKSTRVEGEMAFDMKLVSSAMGYFFSNIVQ